MVGASIESDKTIGPLRNLEEHIRILDQENADAVAAAADADIEMPQTPIAEAAEIDEIDEIEQAPVKVSTDPGSPNPVCIDRPFCFIYAN